MLATQQLARYVHVLCSGLLFLFLLKPSRAEMAFALDLKLVLWLLTWTHSILE